MKLWYQNVAQLMRFYLEHNKKLHFKCLCLTWPTTRDNINTKFLTGPCPTNPRPSPPMLMGSAIGAADKMKDENALQHWRGARAAKIEVRGDAKDLVLISSRLGRRTLSEFAFTPTRAVTKSRVRDKNMADTCLRNTNQDLCPDFARRR